MAITTVAATSIKDSFIGMLNNIRGLGDGPGDAPYPNAFALSAEMFNGMDAFPHIAFGSVKCADAASALEILLDFAPKVVIAIVESSLLNQGEIMFKLAGMGDAEGADSSDKHHTAKVLLHSTAATADFVTATAITLRQESDTTNLNAVTINQARIPANNDVVHYLILGV